LLFHGFQQGVFIFYPRFREFFETVEAVRVFQRLHIETRDLRAGHDASHSAALDEPNVTAQSTARVHRARRRSPEGALTTRSSPSEVVAIAFEATDRFFV